MALILNVHIGDYKRLITTEQFELAKEHILKRMLKYSAPEKFKVKDKSKKDNPLSLYDEFKIGEKQEEEEECLSPLNKILINRNDSMDLKQFWLSKIGTEDQQLAYVALEILGLLITSVLTERSFSKSRYIINNLRTNISPENARDQMILKCNKELAIKAFENINLFQQNE